MLPAGERLRANRCFQEVYRHGKSYADTWMVLYVLPNGDPTVRLTGFSVSKKVGKAHVRNLVKRRLREIYRRLLPRMSRGFHVVVVARRNCAEGSHEELEKALLGLLARARLLEPERLPAEAISCVPESRA